MANIDQQQQDALKFRIRDVATSRAECDRFIASSEAPRGRFVDQAQVEIKAVSGSSDQFQVILARSVTGKPRDAEEPVAFAAVCKVSCVAEFGRNLTLDDIPDRVVQQIALSLFHISTERCRTMVTWMGFPAGPAVTVMPKFQVVKNDAAVEAHRPGTATKKARPKAIARKTPKLSST
ncbi:hypothetical protein [Hydrogenophaga sp.]|uniref:hypothetical protein n=1 Tax=Hydrogenophaga sp. TaxID=1904254 RepID=UPI003F7212FB